METVTKPERLGPNIRIYAEVVRLEKASVYVNVYNKLQPSPSNGPRFQTRMSIYDFNQSKIVPSIGQHISFGSFSDVSGWLKY